MATAANESNILEVIWAQRDVRVDDWPLMNSPLPTVALCALYFFIVKSVGPRFMRDRKPFDLKNTIIVYNLFQVFGRFFSSRFIALTDDIPFKDRVQRVDAL